MSEIEDIMDMEFDKLLEHIDLGELDIVESHTDEHDMSKELLGTVLVPMYNTPSMSGTAHP